ncbi:MAG TPA: ribosome-associated translation inhibitor RaiA [Candidatus Limnocylindrales bacterium]|nr:ribosome-associated translation inhibitor RaiA [Candidatus Limnocylindrales bacterium]
MRTIVRGRNQEVPEADRQYAERKMARLERLLDDRSEAVVELSRQNHRSADQRSLAEVSLDIDGRLLRGMARAATYRAALDEVVDKLERRAVGYKQKPRTKANLNEARDILRTIADGTAEPGSGERPAVAKVKRFAIQPMFEEDAIAAMEELGHRFYVFVNAENERLAVLYARRDGDYGLIEPTVGGSYAPDLPFEPSGQATDR